MCMCVAVSCPSAFKALTAFGKKLLKNPAASVLMLRNLLPNGTGSNSLCEGCDASGRRPRMEWGKWVPTFRLCKVVRTGGGRLALFSYLKPLLCLFHSRVGVDGPDEVVRDVNAK